MNGDRDSASVEVLIGIAGLVLLAHPFYLFPEYGQVPTRRYSVFGLLGRYVLSGVAGATVTAVGVRLSRRELSQAVTFVGTLLSAAVGIYSVQAHDALLTPARVPLWPPTAGTIAFVVTVPVILAGSALLKLFEW
jgi:hypothetical protein